jgi:hypothetical protein
MDTWLDVVLVIVGALALVGLLWLVLTVVGAA